ncbi:MAG: sialidase family protein [Armatimonadota bacterium]|jgi:sialidase-1
MTRAAIGLTVLCALIAQPATAQLEFDFEEPDALAGWLTDIDAWRIEEGRLRQPMVEADSAFAFWPQAFSDLSIEVRFFIHPDGSGVKAPGIVYRATDQRNFYYVHFDSRNAQVVLVRSTDESGWVDPRRHRPVEIAQERWHTARVEVEGGEHRVYLNGELLFTEEDDTLTAGVIGLRAGQGNISFDDLRVEGEPAELEEQFTVTHVPLRFFTVCGDAGGPGAYEAFPDLCMTDDGELLCVFYAGYGHVSFPREDLPRGGFIAMVRSQDLGATWSEARVIVDTPIDDRDPSITQLSNGDLLLTFMTYDRERRPTHEVFTVRSSDGGVTWGESKRVELPWNRSQGVSEPVTELDDGTLLLPVYGSHVTEDGETIRPCAVLRSTDGGESWPEIAVLTPRDEVPFQEPTIEPLSDGRIYMLIRPGMHWSESHDGGVTWMQPEALGMPGQAAYLLETSKGVLLAGYRWREERSTVVIWSHDLGGTWEGPKIVDRVVGGYPSMVELPDGRVLMVYYTEGAGSDIRGVFLDVSEEGVEMLERPD